MEGLTGIPALGIIKIPVGGKPVTGDEIDRLC